MTLFETSFAQFTSSVSGVLLYRDRSAFSRLSCSCQVNCVCDQASGVPNLATCNRQSINQLVRSRISAYVTDVRRFASRRRASCLSVRVSCVFSAIHSFDECRECYSSTVERINGSIDGNIEGSPRRGFRKLGKRNTSLQHLHILEKVSLAGGSYAATGKASTRSDLSPVFGKVDPTPHTSSFNMGYLVSPYPYPNGAGGPIPVSMNSRHLDSSRSSFPFPPSPLAVMRFQETRGMQQKEHTVNWQTELHKHLPNSCCVKSTRKEAFAELAELELTRQMQMVEIVVSYSKQELFLPVGFSSWSGNYIEGMSESLAY
nr:PREDICTED: uncharacterized protein LOC105675670 [Linepithema humile]